MSPRYSTHLIVAVLVALSGSAAADHNQPKKAKSVKLTLVTAYQPCVAPNTITSPGFEWPACVPAVRENATCGFGPDGSGQVVFRMAGDRIGVSVKVKNLDPGCEGKGIAAVFRFDVTGDLCGGETCTLPFDPSWSSCTVTNGRCAFGDTSPFFFLESGGRSGMELRGVDVYADGVKTFRAGTLFE